MARLRVGVGCCPFGSKRKTHAALVSVDIGRLSCSRTAKIKTYRIISSRTGEHTICVVRGSPLGTVGAGVAADHILDSVLG